jgi:dipeptidyl aminopeptidase/acylaminoacyl peptidase
LVLSMITRLSHDWAAAVAIAPPTDLPAFVGKVPPHWRKYMDEWIGNDQPALVARSPLTHAAGVRVPLLIVQGRNDPRVSREDTDRFVSAARAAGAHVDYDVYDDEGHGFDNRMTDARVWQRVSAFIEVHLIRPTQWVDGP